MSPELTRDVAEPARTRRAGRGRHLDPERDRGRGDLGGPGAREAARIARARPRPVRDPDPAARILPRSGRPHERRTRALRDESTELRARGTSPEKDDHAMSSGSTATAQGLTIPRQRAR